MFFEDLIKTSRYARGNMLPEDFPYRGTLYTSYNVTLPVYTQSIVQVMENLPTCVVRVDWYNQNRGKALRPLIRDAKGVWGPLPEDTNATKDA